MHTACPVPHLATLQADVAELQLVQLQQVALQGLEAAELAVLDSSAATAAAAARCCASGLLASAGGLSLLGPEHRMGVARKSGEVFVVLWVIKICLGSVQVLQLPRLGTGLWIGGKKEIVSKATVAVGAGWNASERQSDGGSAKGPTTRRAKQHETLTAEQIDWCAGAHAGSYGQGLACANRTQPSPRHVPPIHQLQLRCRRKAATAPTPPPASGRTHRQALKVIRPNALCVVPGEACNKHGRQLLLAVDTAGVLQHAAQPRHALAAHVLVPAAAIGGIGQRLRAHDADVLHRDLSWLLLLLHMDGVRRKGGSRGAGQTMGVAGGFCPPAAHRPPPADPQPSHRPARV